MFQYSNENMIETITNNIYFQSCERKKLHNAKEERETEIQAW